MSLGIHDYWEFVLTGLLLNLTPGQDTFSSSGAACPVARVLASRRRSASRPARWHTPCSRRLQFIAPDSSHKVLAFLALGATFLTTGTAWCLCLALGSGRSRSFLVERPDSGRALSQMAGAIFVALGARLALSHR